MPRIPDRLQSSVVYLYPSADAAREGRPMGGTGFIVERSGVEAGSSVQYLVTNTHVAQGQDRTVRINATDGSTIFHNVQAHEWIVHPNGDDISAAVFVPQSGWKHGALDWAALAITPARMTEINMGLGDDVFMLGRYIAHDSVQLNQPLARFGNIAMMPGELVKDGREIYVEAFLVEMRSLSGFSGSPVFVHMAPGSDRGNGTMIPFYSGMLGLMGIDTGHRTTLARVKDNAGDYQDDLVVELNTGVSVVAPVWRIAELLDAVSLVSDRPTQRR